jgi:PucR C-terminal helix-turn-helix domain
LPSAKLDDPSASGMGLPPPGWGPGPSAAACQAYLGLGSGQVAARAESARRLLGPGRCGVCPRLCKVNRLGDQRGLCAIGRQAVVASHFPHFGEENCLRGQNGFGTIFFSGCNLRCVFCRNYDISWQVYGEPVTPRRLAAMMLALQDRGCRWAWSPSARTGTRMPSGICSRRRQPARVGISPEYDHALDTGRALGIAAVARGCLPPGSTGVASIDDDWAAAVVAGAPEISARVVHWLLGQVAALPREEQEILLTTLRTWLECGGNASAAARQLYCHRNTVRNRLHRLEALSGQSLSDPRGVAGLSIAARGARFLEQDPVHPRRAPLQQPTATAVPSANARSKILPGREPRPRPRRERR